MRTTIILARHGESVFNQNKIVQGQKNSELTEKGIDQALLLAKRIKKLQPTKIITSNLKRAIQTAEIVAKDLGLQINKMGNLNERNFGEYEGKMWEDVDKELDALKTKIFLHQKEQKHLKPFTKE